MFASFPRLLGDVTPSVAEILPNNVLSAFPGGEWNTFNPTTSSENMENRFVNVNAVLTDSHNNLWVVDSGMIGNKTTVNAAKLVKINLQNNTVERIYSVSSLNPPEGFALNDVRIGSHYAFLTESGLGSVVIINLQTGQVRRVLDNHPSTKFVDPTVVRMEGRAILDEKGQPKKMHNNHLELTPDEKTLFYKPPFGYNWFQVSTDDLTNETMTESELGNKVFTSWKAMPTGGTTMDDAGNIYLMDIERQTVWQQNSVDGSWTLLIHDERINWGDASDVSADGFLYIPMSQINRLPSSNNGTNRVEKPFQMSPSKFESLPNEILTDIIEKYVNGVDLLRAFSFQLNQRFDSLIIQSQRLRFDFIQCYQDDFRFCMGLLPAYINKIEELAISEQNTPGQVYAFLSFFRSFALFQQLRKLYFHFNDQALDWNIIQDALHSLLKTKVDTLSIKASIKENRFVLGTTIARLFGLNSLKSFSLLSDLDNMNWNDLGNMSSNIEHLTISGIHCRFQDLQYIFQCTPRLKYLDVEIVGRRMAFYGEKGKHSKIIIPLMSTLRKLILYFADNSLVTMDMLTEYLNSMLALKYLEIKAHSELLDANGWKLLLETSLPLLTHFILRTALSRVKRIGLDNVLSSFQNSYWVSKQNFNLMITEHEHWDSDDFGIDETTSHIRHEFDCPVIRC
ncbi:unnamed protein product [Rotaria sp. Silwood1]|nr:unnamed protein product [Rotaria sp. Silwood1]CAF1587034.1 unnamed protein product [Rotaria sp. Silwood1]